MNRGKRDEDREFCLRMAIQQQWSFRALQQQRNGPLFESAVLSQARLSTLLAELHPDTATAFNDSYLVGSLKLPKDYTHADLQVR
jgi:predicted nuclease of restriction endonuclease-like (RecB) superfamily